MKKTYGLISILAMAFLTVSCAVEKSESSKDFFDKELAAWVRVNYPDRISQKTAEGAYILEYEQGTGVPVSDTGYVYAHFWKKDLTGNIAATNLQALAEQLGTYTNAKYYGSDVWKIGQGSICVPVEEILKKMKVGGHVKIAVPVSASTIEHKVYNAFESSEDGNVVFDITVDDVRGDVYKAQKATLKEYSRKYSSIDTSSDNFYLKILKRSASEKDSIKNGDGIKVRYVARLLDGHVFDTNIADTAKKYRIYTSGGSYDPLEITYYDNLSDMSTKNSFVDGFLTAVIKMKKNETAETFFWSSLGYDASGSDEVVPEYSPLSFYIEIPGD